MLKSVQISAPKMAAIAYFIYGTVYLIGALLELDPSRRIVFWGFVPWWAFYVAGAALIATIPIFIMKGVRWLTWFLTFAVSGKCLWLVWIQGRRLSEGTPPDFYNIFFAAVAGITAILLLRAALERRQPVSSDGQDTAPSK